MTLFIKYCLDDKTYHDGLRQSTYSLSALLDLIEISGSIESLSQSFARDRILVPGQQHSMKLSPAELHQMRRSFWRFQFPALLRNVSSRKFETSSSGTLQRRIEKHDKTCPSIISPDHQTATSYYQNWLHCRDENIPSRSPEPSRFLPNLSLWEQDELEPVHPFPSRAPSQSKSNIYDLAIPIRIFTHNPYSLLRRLNPRHRPLGSTQPNQRPRLSRIFPPKQTHPTTLPHRLGRKPATSSTPVRSPNTARIIAMQGLQKGQRQWDWCLCLWDEARLFF